MTDITQTAAKPATAPDYAAIKSKQNAAWSSGDYGKIGVTLQITGENLAEAMDLCPGSQVLDVAAGNGNATLAFARRWCEVISTDYVEILLQQGRIRAEAEALTVTHRIADAEELPFENESFDAVISTFGVMFAPNQLQAAKEMLRVCRPGGKIGLANWKAEGFIGQVFKTIGAHVPPPAGLNPLTVWGSKQWIEDVFAAKARSITVRDRFFLLRYRSPGHFLEFFRTYYGPIQKAFIALDTSRQAALASDLNATIEHFNTAADGSMRVPSAYSEIVISKL